jgi:hypothetical protein
VRTAVFGTLAMGIFACAPAFAAARTELPLDQGSPEKPKVKLAGQRPPVRSKDKNQKRTKDEALKNRRAQTPAG